VCRWVRWEYQGSVSGKLISGQLLRCCEYMMVGVGIQTQRIHLLEEMDIMLVVDKDCVPEAGCKVGY